jgi:hypothetical protein
MHDEQVPTMAKRIKPKRGDVFRVPLEGGTHAYGHLIGSILQGFYALQTNKDLPLEEIVKLPVAFRVQGMTDRIANQDWPIVGNTTPPAEMNAPIRFGQEQGPDAFLLVEWTAESSEQARRASFDEIKGLEKDGVWDSTFVLERLVNFFQGIPCPHVKVF